MTARTCSALAYRLAMEHRAAGELLARQRLLFLSNRGGSRTDLLVHPEVCRFGDSGACGAAVGSVRQVVAQTRLPDLARNPKVTFTLCPAAPASRHLEFAAVDALGTASAADSEVVQRDLGWARYYAAQLGTLPQARPGLWEQVAACAGSRFLRLAHDQADVDAEPASAFVTAKMAELTDRALAEIGANTWSDDTGPRWWVTLPAASATSTVHLDDEKLNRSLLLFRAPLDEVLLERPGALLAWQVPQWFLRATDGTGGGWPVMPVGADRESDLMVLRTVAASGAEGSMVAKVASAAQVAQT